MVVVLVVILVVVVFFVSLDFIILIVLTYVYRVRISRSFFFSSLFLYSVWATSSMYV